MTCEDDVILKYDYIRNKKNPVYNNRRKVRFCLLPSKMCAAVKAVDRYDHNIINIKWNASFKELP